jgi:N4-gp56 family major capsid protein
VIWSQKWLCDSPNQGTKALEIGRNDLSTRERGNRVLILRDYIVSAASEINAGGGSNNDNPTNLGISDFSLVATTLSTNNAYKFTSGIEGEDRFGTGPIRSAFFMLSSTELQTDFDSLVGSGYISAWNYPNTANALPSEVGSVFNIRILTSSEAPVARNASANNQDVYYNTVLGKQALTHIGQDGYSMELLYRDRLYSGYLGQNVTLGVSFAQAQAITQDTAIRNLLCTSLYSSQIV